MKDINDNQKNITSLFIEDGDKKVWNKFKEDIPQNTFKPWQVTKKVVKLPLHFIFDGFKINRTFSKLKIFGNINFFKGPINRTYNIVFNRKNRLTNQEKKLIKKSIETMDQKLRIATIKKIQRLVLFLMLILVLMLLLPILFFQVKSIIVYINIGLSYFLLFLLIIARLKDAYILKHAEFDKKYIFHRQFWNLSTSLPSPINEVNSSK
jgi:hypothetical protein